MEAASGTIAEAPSGLSSETHEHHRAPHQTLPTRPKRADARRNYEKVLAAAREAFAEGGESTSLEEIARRAGVGIGTLYRNFPNRQALLEAALRRRGRGDLPLGRGARGSRPWEALNAWFERFIGYIATKQALAARAAQLPRPRRAAVPGLPRARSSRPASRCSRAPRRPASCGPTSTSPRSSRWSSGSRRSRPPSPSRPSTSSEIALDGLRYRPA